MIFFSSPLRKFRFFKIYQNHFNVSNKECRTTSQCTVNFFKVKYQKISWGLNIDWCNIHLICDKLITVLNKLAMLVIQLYIH